MKSNIQVTIPLILPNTSYTIPLKLSRFRKGMSPLGPAPKLPTVSSSGSSEDEEDEDILISPQEAHRRTAAEDAQPFGAEQDHHETDIFTPNDASGPIESPFSEPGVQQAVATELLDAPAAFF